MQNPYRKSQSDQNAHRPDPTFGHPRQKDTGENAHGPDSAHQDPFVRPEDKIGRNDPCPCGSGKKFKKCCGAAE